MFSHASKPLSSSRGNSLKLLLALATVSMQLVAQSSPIVGDRTASETWVRYYLERGDYGRAIDRARKILAEVVRAWGADNENIIGQLDDLRIALQKVGNKDEAEQVRVRMETIRIKKNLKWFDEYYKERQYDRAIKVAKKWLAEVKQSLGTQHPLAIDCMLKIAYGYEKLADYPEADQWFDQAFAIAEAIYKPDDPEMATQWQVKGARFLNRGDFRSAVPALECSMAIQAKAGEQRKPRYLTTLIMLASVQTDLGDLPKAEISAKQALDLAQSLYTSDRNASSTLRQLVG
jgi:tetratricopeptide (TPR) repeat protein